MQSGGVRCGGVGCCGVLYGGAAVVVWCFGVRYGCVALWWCGVWGCVVWHCGVW